MASEPARTGAMILREASQMAGISGPESWDDISERRREQWNRIAKALFDNGAVLLDSESVAALRTVLDLCDEFDDLEAFAQALTARIILRAALEGPR